jgi:type IV pilus assembly protein PilB
LSQNLISEADLAVSLSCQYDYPYVDLKKAAIDPQGIDIINEAIARKHLVMPVSMDEKSIKIAMADPLNFEALGDLRFLTGRRIIPAIAGTRDILEAIETHYRETRTHLATILRDITDADPAVTMFRKNEDEDVSRIAASVDYAPVVKIANSILSEAIHKGVSDIHIEPFEDNLRIRYRLDGVLQEAMVPPVKYRAALTSRMKIMAALDIAERRIPQDGRIKLRMEGKEVDLRVSTFPGLFGEKVVIRILDKSNLTVDLTQVGFEPKALDDFTRAISSPYGMVLVTGPTGSGKTTTLYSALNQLNKVEVNIMTAEDPVEYNLPGVNQGQVREDVGLNFAAALRSFLRQDPDVIMVGEIRDYETAEIAVKAALTGHLVLSTLHTNDAPSTVNRLLNMGIEPFLAASSVNLIMAQRLVRRVCNDCREIEKVDDETLLQIGFSEEEAGTVTCCRGKGCPTCSHTGYKGRIAIFEVMPVENGIRRLILEGAPADEIKEKAIRSGMMTLRRSGLAKIAAGVTSIEEVLKGTFQD